MVAQRFHNFPVNKIEHHRPLLDERHLHSERRQHRGVFQADHSAANDDGFLRNFPVPHHLIGIQNVFSVELNFRIVRGARAARDHNVLAANCGRRADPLNFQGVRIHESRRAVQHHHIVAHQLRAE